MQLRPYQRAAIDAAYQYLANDDGNPVVVCPTGSGKTLLLAQICSDVVESGGRVLVVSHVKELLQQQQSALQAICPDVEVGLYSAGLKARDTTQPVIVAGVQSIYRKATELGKFSVVIVDEAHLIPLDGEGMYRQMLGDLAVVNPQVRVIGLTATPYRLKDGLICEPDHFLNDICFEVGVQELIDDGFLCPLRSKGGTEKPDLSAVHVRGGEYKLDELEDAFNDDDLLVGRACAEIVNLTADRKSVLIFASGIQHAMNVAHNIKNFAAKECGFICGETDADERAETLKRFKSGELKYLSNVNVLCLDEETEILTGSGWCGIDEMTKHHQIAAWSTDGHIEFTPPELIVRRMLKDNETFAVVKGKNNNIRVTGNHRMVIKGDDGNWIKTSADSIIDKPATMPCSGQGVPFHVPILSKATSKKTLGARVRSLSYVYRKKGHEAGEARTKAVEHVHSREHMSYTAPENLTHDECALIGFWLGDGSLSGGRCVISQAIRYSRIVTWIDNTLQKTGIHHSRHVRQPKAENASPYVVWSLARGTGGDGQKVNKGFFCLEPYLNKQGTELLWGLSESQWTALMYGFWMADGNHGNGTGNSGRGVSVAGTQKALYDMLQAVGTCRGYSVTITPLKDRGNPRHSAQWRMSWRKAEKIQLLRDVLQKETPAKSERVWCVTSSTGNIITRRQGKVIVTGNTTGFDAPNVDCVVLLRATLSPGLYCQMVGRGFRLHESKSDCLILDYGDNITRHGPVDAIKVKDKKPTTGGEAPVRECPDCHEIVAAGHKECPECGCEFPPPESDPHATTASENSILSKDEPAYSDETFEVTDVSYNEHIKRGAAEDTPHTMRVTYDVYLGGSVSEWICIEHSGWVRGKAVNWWEQRTDMDCPKTVAEAVELADQGHLQCPHSITVRTKAGERWPSVVSCSMAEGLDITTPEELPF